MEKYIAQSATQSLSRMVFKEKCNGINALFTEKPTNIITMPATKAQIKTILFTKEDLGIRGTKFTFGFE